LLSKEECVNCLEKIYKENIDEGKVITRNFFRANSGLSDSEWQNHFGTFTEFKRAAGIDATRHQNALNNQIARHASVENYRSMNIEKSGWEGTYLKPSGKRFQTIMVASDIHDINADPFYINLFVDTIQRIKPERIIFNGDIFDLPEFSKYTVDPREYNIVERIKWVQQFFLDVREASPDSQIDLIEGNHEFRLVRHLSEASPGLKIILSDLLGLGIADLLGLKEFNINFYARADLSAFNQTNINAELSKNYIICNDQVLFHHFPYGKEMGYPGAHGHHHRHMVWNSFNPRFGSFEWHQLGSGHRRQASYTAGEKWSNGFLLCHLDTTNYKTQFEYIDTSHEHCFIGGKFYQRNGKELENLF
jgi:hypothetical protein